MARKFKTKIFVVEAVQNTGKNLKSIALIIGCDVKELQIFESGLVYYKLFGHTVFIVRHRDWIVKNRDGSKTTLSDLQFTAQYEPA